MDELSPELKALIQVLARAIQGEQWAVDLLFHATEQTPRV